MQINAQEQRRQRKRIRVFFLIVYGLLVLYFALQMASYLNTHPRVHFLNAIGPTFTEIPKYPFSFCLTGTRNADAFIPLIIFYFCTAAFLYVDDVRHYHDLGGKEAGSAQWNNDRKKFAKEFTSPTRSENMLLTNETALDMNTRKTRRNNNVLIIGGSGAGKSRGHVKPNILQANCNYVVTDPAGDLLSSTGEFLTEEQYKIKVFNLVEKTKSCCYNPFHYIRNAEGILMMIHCIIQNTTPPEQKSSEPFWDKAEDTLLSALSFFLWEFRPPEEQNFSTVMKLLRWADKDEQGKRSSKLDRIFLKSAKNANIDNEVRQFLSSIVYTDADGKKRTNKDCLPIEEIAPTSLALSQYQNVCYAPAKTFNSVVISCKVRLHAFDIPDIAALTNTDNIHLEDLGGTNNDEPKQALFVIIPAADSTFNFLVAIMYSQLFETLYYIAETQCKSVALPRHVKFLLDEFANVGQIGEFTKKLSTMRKYEISCNIILQNISQIKAMYKDDWETIVGNCDSFLFLGGKEYTSLEYISKLLGDQTITSRDRSFSPGKKSSGSQNFKQQSRKLLNPDELAAIPNDHCVLIITGINPFYDKKFDYTTHPNYHRTADAVDARRYLIPYNTFDKSEDDLNIEAQQIADQEETRQDRIAKIANYVQFVLETRQWSEFPNAYKAFKCVPDDLSHSTESATLNNRMLERTTESAKRVSSTVNTGCMSNEIDD